MKILLLNFFRHPLMLLFFMAITMILSDLAYFLPDYGFSLPAGIAFATTLIYAAIKILIAWLVK